MSVVVLRALLLGCTRLRTEGIQIRSIQKKAFDPRQRSVIRSLSIIQKQKMIKMNTGLSIIQQQKMNTGLFNKAAAVSFTHTVSPREATRIIDWRSDSSYDRLAAVSARRPDLRQFLQCANILWTSQEDTTKSQAHQPTS